MNAHRSVVRLSMTPDVFLEFERNDSKQKAVAVSPHRNPDKYLVSLQSRDADHVFLIDTVTGTLETQLFATKGAAVPWVLAP